MIIHLQETEKKEKLVNKHGEEKWRSTLENLANPEMVAKTYSSIKIGRAHV